MLVDFGPLRKLVPNKFHKQKRIATNLVLPVSFYESLSLIINSNKVMLIIKQISISSFFKLLQTVTTKSLLLKEFSFQKDSCE